MTEGRVKRFSLSNLVAPGAGIIVIVAGAKAQVDAGRIDARDNVQLFPAIRLDRHWNARVRRLCPKLINFVQDLCAIAECFAGGVMGIFNVNSNFLEPGMSAEGSADEVNVSCVVKGIAAAMGGDEGAAVVD